MAAFRAAGFLQVELPHTISPARFMVQGDHARGLGPYLYRVHTSTSQRELILRPTSEIPFTDLFGDLLRRGRQLPFKYVQEVTVFRDEKPSQFVPFLRQREIAPFIESYTMVGSEEEAEHQLWREVGVYEGLLRRLSVPFEISIRPKEDTFPEARYTVAFDSPIEAGVFTQVATVHHLGTSFADAARLRTERGIPCQCSTGISGRALGVSWFRGWTLAPRTETYLTDSDQWPWHGRGAAQFASDEKVEMHSCCTRADCRARLQLRLSAQVLGWSVKRNIVKCDYCGQTTRPLLAATVF
jgi:hypothetical protein